MDKNEICVLQAERTLSFYATIEACHPDSSLIDLITDLRYYCGDHGFDFDYFSKISKMRLDAEVGGNK